jgi:TRAP-type C4-dicarboxylate transport system permease small subunit
MKYLDLIRLWANKTLAALAATTLLGMVCLACANIVLRTLDSPIKGTFELMGFMGAVVAGFSLGYAQLAKGHIAVSVLKGVFPQWFERAVDALCALTGTLFFAAAAYQVWDVANFMVEFGELSETLRFAYHPFVYAVAVGCGAMALTMAVDAVHLVLGGNNPEAA